MVPDRIFKYQSLTAQSLANLKSRSFWFSAPAQFNDPFDCALQVANPDLTTAEVLRLYEYVKAEHGISSDVEASLWQDGEPTPIARNILTRAALDAFEEMRQTYMSDRGVACFCACADDVLMWSHYADGHRGFCLEFATSGQPFASAQQVVYAPDVPVISVTAAIGDGIGAQLRDAMILTKHQRWHYEREWRLFHMSANTSFTYDYSLLTGVYLGAAMSVAHRDLVAQLLLGSPTQLYTMSRPAGSFRVEAQAVSYAPFKYS